jgi:hypothetical protein
MQVSYISSAYMPPFFNFYIILLKGEIIKIYKYIISWNNNKEAIIKTFNSFGFLLKARV